MDLKKLLTDGETIYNVVRASGRTISIIGEQVEDPERKLDLSGCIEDTLHRLLDAGATDDDILDILDAEKCEKPIETDTDYYIDLAYIIKAFYPEAIRKTGLVYERPVHIFTAQTNVQIPDDPTDDEVLEAASKYFRIDPQWYIVEDIYEQVFLIRSLLNPKETYVLSMVQEGN